MNWSYLAGLFDGEGCVTITRGTGWFIKPAVNIAANSKVLRAQIRLFLSQNSIKSTESSTRNPSGRSARVSAFNWGECKAFVEKLLKSEVIEKRPQLETFLLAVRTWEERNALTRHEYLTRMDDFRRKLHRFAKKGPKTLKEWTFPAEGSREAAARQRRSRSSGKSGGGSDVVSESRTPRSTDPNAPPPGV